MTFQLSNCQCFAIAYIAQNCCLCLLSHFLNWTFCVCVKCMNRVICFFLVSLLVYGFDSIRSLSRSVSRAPIKKTFVSSFNWYYCAWKEKKYIFFVCLNKFMCVVQFVTLPTATAKKNPPYRLCQFFLISVIIFSISFRSLAVHWFHSFRSFVHLFCSREFRCDFSWYIFFVSRSRVLAPFRFAMFNLLSLLLSSYRCIG